MQRSGIRPGRSWLAITVILKRHILTLASLDRSPITAYQGKPRKTNHPSYTGLPSRPPSSRKPFRSLSHALPSPKSIHHLVPPPSPSSTYLIAPHTPLGHTPRTMESRSTSPRGRKRDRLGNEISSSAVAGALSPSPRSGANTPSTSTTGRRPPVEEEEPRYVGDPSYLEVSCLPAVRKESCQLTPTRLAFRV